MTAARAGPGARLLAPAVPWLMRRSLRRGLAGVWLSAPTAVSDLGPRGAVVVANHHSWWDGYLVWALARHTGRPLAMLIDEATLRRFPFFRLLGGLGPTELRRAVRRAQGGAWVGVFAEGALGPVGRLAPFAAGGAAISRWADVPVLPLAIRVVLRARQRPEAYLRLGQPLPVGAAAEDQHRAVAQALREIDEGLGALGDPRAVPAGARLLLPGSGDDHQRAARLLAPWRRP